MPNLSPPPLTTPIVELQPGPGVTPGQMTAQFANWQQELMNRAQVASASRAGASLTNQVAAIGTTVLLAQANGVYRISWRLRIRTAAGTSSSVQVSVAAIEGGVAVVQTGVALTSNLPASPASGAFLVHADPSTVLSISVAYASVGAPAAAYDVDWVVEALS